MDSTSQTAPTHSDITNEVLSQVTEEFANPSSPTDAEIMNKLLSRVTYGFDSRNSI